MYLSFGYTASYKSFLLINLSQTLLRQIIDGCLFPYHDLTTIVLLTLLSQHVDHILYHQGYRARCDSLGAGLSGGVDLNE